jgi:hypothetical protein
MQLLASVSTTAVNMPLLVVKTTSGLHFGLFGVFLARHCGAIRTLSDFTTAPERKAALRHRFSSIYGHRSCDTCAAIMHEAHAYSTAI